MNNPTFVSQEDALEIVFSHRNRAYGAYQLRRQYPKTLARALGFGLLLIALMVALPQLLKAFSGLLPSLDTEEIAYVIREIPLPPPPKPMVPSTPPPVARSTQRFVPPVVDEDEKVDDEPPKLANDDLLKDPADVGKTTVDVLVQAPPRIDDPGLGGLIESPKPSGNDELVESYDVQRPPSFPGGERELMQFLAKNIEYPDQAREANIQGVVAISFVIGKDGEITNVEVLKDIGGGCGKEAVRVVKSMPKWSPGEANGHTVRVRFTIPVRFKLN